MSMLMMEPSSKDAETICELLRSKQVVPLIHRHITLQEIPKALRELENRGVRGKIVVDVSAPELFTYFQFLTKLSKQHFTKCF